MNRVSETNTSMPARRFLPFGPGQSSSTLRAIVIIGILAIVCGVLVGRFNPLLNHAASVEGTLVDTLFSVMLGAAATIFVIVEGALIYSMVAFRHRGSLDDDSDEDEITPVRGHLGMEVLWTAIPAALVTIVALSSYFVLATIESPKPDAVTVEVTGRQFGWQFYYPSLDVTSSELRVPAGRQVLLKLHSADVIHQFWVPAYRIKRDVMPDRVTELRFTANQEGSFPIVCTKICGVGHSGMRSTVVATKSSEFDAWLAQQANGALAIKTGQANDPLARGRQIFQEQGCAACHTLKDANANGKAGPDLDGIATNAENIVKDPGYKGKAQNGADYIHESIVDPNAYVVPGFQANMMPQDLGKRLSPDDLNALIQYLQAQK